jgi:F0F1-type ATP synthase epsilon subunit
MRETVDLTIQTPVSQFGFPKIDVLQILLEDGWAEFFPNHAPFIALTSAGEAIIEREGECTPIAHSKGVLRIDETGFLLIMRVAVPLEEGQSFREALEKNTLLATEVRREHLHRDLMLESRLWQLLLKRR